MNKLKRNAPMIGMLATVGVFATGCTLDDVLNIAKIISLFL